jgi:DNA primase
MARYSKQLDLSSAQGKREFSDVLLPVVRELADPVERDHYLGAIAEAIGTSREVLEQKFTKIEAPAPARRRNVKTDPQKEDKAAIENRKLQDNFLSLMLARLTLREFLGLITPEMLYTDEARELLGFLNKNPEFDGKKAAPELKNLADYVKLEALLYEELYQGVELNELHDEAARLQARLIENFVKAEKKKLADQLDTATPAATRDLLGQSKKYDELLKQVKGAAYGRQA